VKRLVLKPKKSHVDGAQGCYGVTLTKEMSSKVQGQNFEMSRSKHVPKVKVDLRSRLFQ